MNNKKRNNQLINKGFLDTEIVNFMYDDELTTMIFKEREKKVNRLENLKKEKKLIEERLFFK